MTLRTGCSRGRTPKVVRPQQRKNPLPFSFSERSHIGNLRQIRKQGKGRSSKRKENRRLSFLFAPAAGAATLPPSADGESPPAEVQRKTFRPLGANTLTQFEYPAQPVLKRSRPSGANPLAQFVSPTQPVLKKGCRPVRGEPACGSSCPLSWSVQEIYTKRAAAPMQQLFSMQNLNRTGSKPKFPRRYARSPR